MESVERAKESRATTEDEAERQKERLNSLIAVTIALLATFLGLCQVTAGNVAQAMAKAESERVNGWAWYQARNIREEVMKATAVQMETMARAAPPEQRALWTEQAAQYRNMEKEQLLKQKETKQIAEDNSKLYELLNKRDDQFDLSEALLAIAIALLALCSLTAKRWLFFVAMVPTFFGVLMGMSGLLKLPIHFDFLTKYLS
jgi:hypothetical protein